MVDLGAYKDKFGDSGQRVLEYALNESRRRDQNFVAVEHILEGGAGVLEDVLGIGDGAQRNARRCRGLPGGDCRACQALPGGDCYGRFRVRRCQAGTGRPGHVR